MPSPLTAPALLDKEYLEIRAKILELAASFDRLDRAEGSVENDPRRDLIDRGLAALNRATADRAEQVQLIFSLPYEEGWRKRYFNK